LRRKKRLFFNIYIDPVFITPICGRIAGTELMSGDTSIAVPRPDLVALTSTIVAAYVSRNPMPTGELAGLIRLIHATLSALAADLPRSGLPRLAPAVPVHLSIEDDFIVCLEDGLKFKSLKRHLRARYDMTPEQYREKWGLPSDYPMVAPGYSRTRSKLARASGLGRGERG
jgi:predicted transcriptional regulator